MARKYDLISELYNRTCKTVVSSPKSWQDFLTSACRNYKLRFDEQLHLCLPIDQKYRSNVQSQARQSHQVFGRKQATAHRNGAYSFCKQRSKSLANSLGKIRPSCKYDCITRKSGHIYEPSGNTSLSFNFFILFLSGNGKAIYCGNIITEPSCNSRYIGSRCFALIYLCL